MFEASVIAAYESLSCPQCGNMDLKIIQSSLKGFKYTKMLENLRICGFFLKNSSSLTVQDKQGTHEQLSLN